MNQKLFTIRRFTIYNLCSKHRIDYSVRYIICSFIISLRGRGSHFHCLVTKVKEISNKILQSKLQPSVTIYRFFNFLFVILYLLFFDLCFSHPPTLSVRNIICTFLSSFRGRGLQHPLYSIDRKSLPG